MSRVTLLLALAFAIPSTCQACAMVGVDPNAPIRITDESALIVWDAKARTEHFVRRASFQTQAKNFGFLVPTPSQPQLGAVEDELFNDLERELLPKTKTVVQRGINPTPFVVAVSSIKGCAGGDADYTGAANAAAGSDGEVEVVEQKRVGDYNASVLKASDTRALLKWLRDHRYAVSSGTRKWLVPYIKAGYFLTAFQIASNVKEQSARAKAVRLSFKSEAPFYPYREPERAQKDNSTRTLRVFFVGDNRVTGTIGNKNKSAQWPAKMDYSAALEIKNLQEQGVTLPKGPVRLTAFTDASAPRPGWGDLQFSPSSDQSELTPPPNIVYEDKRLWVPLDIAAFAMIFLVGQVWQWRVRNST